MQVRNTVQRNRKKNNRSQQIRTAVSLSANWEMTRAFILKWMIFFSTRAGNHIYFSI